MTNFSDFNKYPHVVFASVALIDGKIVNWKVGKCRWSIKNIWHFTHPIWIFKHSEKVKIRTRSFVVKNGDEHDRAFGFRANTFFRRYPLHENFCLLKPYKENQENVGNSII